MGGSGQNSLAETGSNMLSGLFGRGTLDTMAQTIGKFAGSARAPQVDARHAWPPGPWRVRSAATQHGSRRKRAGVPSHLTEGSDRRRNTVRSRRSVKCRRSHRQSDRKRAQRCGRGQPAANRRGFGADRFTGWSAASAATRTTAASQWPYWLLAAVALGGLAWYALGRPGDEKVAQVPPPSMTRTAPEP